MSVRLAAPPVRSAARGVSTPSLVRTKTAATAAPEL
jgi:hypothetical protein